MVNSKIQVPKLHLIAKFSVYILVLAAGFGLLAGMYVWAADSRGPYPDKAGQEALRLWAERERDRAFAEAARRYWDYRLLRPPRYFSAHRLRLKLEQMQKWLQDPKHHKPPPPPPYYWPPYPYSLPYYCPPPPWYPPPYFYPYYWRHYRGRE